MHCAPFLKKASVRKNLTSARGHTPQPGRISQPARRLPPPFCGKIAPPRKEPAAARRIPPSARISFRTILPRVLIFIAGARPLSARPPVALNPESLPRIESFSASDTMYRQFCAAVEFNDRKTAARRAQAGGESGLLYEFYTYTAGGQDTLFSVAAALNIPYDTIATLNSLDGASVPLAGRRLVVPSVKGIFVRERPVSSVEMLVAKEYQKKLADPEIVCYTVSGQLFYFLPDERFSATARAFFLDASIRMPLDSSWVSSAYGMRVSPVSGTWKMHGGIDLAAPEGTPVYACKRGKVALCVRNDAVFGNYVILRHAGGMTSVYAHLSEIAAREGDEIDGGDRIGLVGSTGAATGPHLHFEIRMNGVSTDPAGLLPNEND